MLDAQRAGGVDVRHVAVTGEVSGRAIIEVDDSGDNRIVVVSGANSLLTPQMVIGALDDVDPAVVMTQLESPERVTAAVAEWCGRRDRRLVLNPSPVAPLRSEVIAASNPLVVNEIEAAYYADASSGDVDADAEAVARELCATAKSVVITLGADGVVAADGPGSPVSPWTVRRWPTPPAPETISPGFWPPRWPVGPTCMMPRPMRPARRRRTWLRDRGVDRSGHPRRQLTACASAGGSGNGYRVRH